MTTIRLNKLLWLMDKEAFLQTTRTITGSPYIRKRFGPVPQNYLATYNAMADKGYLKIVHSRDDNFEKTKYTARRKATLSCFDDDELGIMREVLDKYGSASVGRLVKLSHDLTWARHEDGEKIPFEAYLSAVPNARRIPVLRKIIEEEEAKYAALGD